MPGVVGNSSPAEGIAPSPGAAPDLERMLRSLFERSSNAMVVLDDRRRFTAANAAAAGLLGVPRKRLLELRVDDLTPETLRPCLEEGWPEFLQEGSIVQRRTVSTPDGRTIEVDYCASAHVLPGRHLAVYLEDDPDPAETAAEAGPPPNAPLTPREIEVVELLAMGLTGSGIAERLVISPETVRTHVRNAMEKRGARTRAHLIAMTVRDGLLGP